MQLALNLEPGPGRLLSLGHRFTSTLPMSTLRWGLLGTARISRKLIPPLRSSARNRLHAVASRSEQRAEEYAREWEIPAAYGSYRALLEDESIDVVYVPVPNHLHAEWSVRSLRAGKHVLCEKPLALTEEEVDEIERVAEQTDRVIAEAFMYRHHPQTRRIRTLVREGAIGTLRLLRSTFTFSLRRPEDIRWEPDKGGGSLWDVGCYPVSFVRYVTGREPIQCFGEQRIGTTGVDVQFTAQMEFPNGTYAQIDAGFEAPERKHSELVGTEGVLRIPNTFKPGLSPALRLVREGEVETIRIEGEELYAGEIEDMADAVLEGESPRIGLRESRGNVASINRLYRSAEEGTPID